MSDTDLAAFLDLGWAQLARGMADKDHPARHVTLATIGADGPEQRMLVLRGADRQRGTVELHTDSATAKLAELARDPRAALHIWVPSAQLQLRLCATVRALPSDPDRWALIPDAARFVYGGHPAPGTTIDSPDAFTEGATPERFTALVCDLRRIEVLELGARPHRRARFERSAPGWRGRWIAP